MKVAARNAVQNRKNSQNMLSHGIVFNKKKISNMETIVKVHKSVVKATLFFTEIKYG